MRIERFPSIANTGRQAKGSTATSVSGLRAVFQALPDSYFRLTAEGLVLDCQVGAGAGLSGSPAEVVGSRIIDLLPPHAAWLFGDAIRQVHETKAMVALEYAVTKDGDERVFEARLAPFLERQIIAVVRDISERKRADEALRGSEAKLRRQNRVLAELARSRMDRTQDFSVSARAMTEVAAQTLDVERVGVWIGAEGETAIRCVDLFVRSARKHCKGPALAAADCPAYFDALARERIIAAHQAQADPRTSALAASYLAPLGIGSLLVVPIRVNGRAAGAVCCEHVGPPRRWMVEDQQFAALVADILSSVLERQERRS